MIKLVEFMDFDSFTVDENKAFDTTCHYQESGGSLSDERSHTKQQQEGKSGEQDSLNAAKKEVTHGNPWTRI